MEEKKLITLALTSYNKGKYIQKMLDSIKEQTVKDFELVISDNVSTDNSAEIIQKFIDENPEIPVNFVIQKENIGMSGNRNAVLKMAKGKYIMFLDPDDFLEKDCIETYINALKEDDYDRIIGEINWIDGNDKLIQQQKMIEGTNKWYWLQHQSNLYKKSIIEENKLEFRKEIIMDEDTIFVSNFNLYAKKIKFVNKPLHNYRTKIESISSSKKNNTPNTDDIKLSFKYYNEFFHQIENEKEKNDYMYKCTNMYYYHILNRYRYTNLHDTLNYYDEIRKDFLEKFPNYKENSLLKFGSKVPMRNYGKLIMKTCVTLEKLHLMKIALIGYHIISKFHYFKI